MTVFNDNLYIGFPNRNVAGGDGPKKPYFIKITSFEPLEALDLEAYNMPGIGYYGGNTAQRVGIDTTNPDFTLHVNGEAGKPGGGSWSDFSDGRLKKNIQDLTSALDKIIHTPPFFG